MASRTHHLAAAAAAIAVIAGCAGCASSHTAASLPTRQVRATAVGPVPDVHCAHGPAPFRTAAPIPAAGLAALHQLGSLEATGRGMPVPSQHGARTLRDQLRVAERAACGLLDVKSVEAAGYYYAFPNVEGVGTHFIDWAQVNQPFDPAHPSMLLFSAEGARSRLVGFSYWVRSPVPPAGFTGSLDVWHQHIGACFDAAGHWSDDGVPASQCHGTYLGGRDLWMLHAWIVPGFDNPAGVFAPVHRSLCHRNVPDIARCPSGHVVH